MTEPWQNHDLVDCVAAAIVPRMKTAHHPSRLTLFVCVAIALPAALAACGDDDPKADTADTTAEVDVDTNDDVDTTLPDLPEDVPDDTAEVTGPTLAIHYRKVGGDYTGLSARVTGDVVGGPLFASTGTDAFGVVFEVPLAEGAADVAIQITGGAADDPAEALAVSLAEVNGGVWLFEGGALPLLSAPPAIPGTNELVIHYLRKDGQYDGWGLHLWEDVAQETAWTAPRIRDGIDPRLGAFWRVPLKDGAAKVGVIVHRGDEKDPGPDMFVDLGVNGSMVFFLSGSSDIFSFPVKIPALAIAGAGAHWLDAGTIAWTSAQATSWELRHSLDGAVEATEVDVVGGEVIALTPVSGGLSASLKSAFPHLATRAALALPSEVVSDLSKIETILKGEVVLVARDAEGKPVDATRVQIPGVLDTLYTYDGPLGATWSSGAPSIALWAPTAQDVKLVRFDAAKAPLGVPLAMTRGQDGVWRLTGEASWKGTHYLYEVKVFHPVVGRVVTTRVTDPYAIALAEGSTHTLLVDPMDPALAPSGWAATAPPLPEAPEDITLYELHLRDFSAEDQSVPAADRGTYTAFTYNGRAGRALSKGMEHLEALADAGLSHLHLLPSFDIATIPEDPDRRVDIGAGFDRLCEVNTSVPAALCTEHGTTPIREVLESLDPTTGDAQALHAYIRPLDGFNWGYDPFHYNVPEGSYASSGDGVARIIEFRRMVQALSEIGLGLVIDVVYNHTNASGIGDTSVLDKVVPGYYHRLNPDSGQVETSTCCANTATEHAMMRRLMVDSVRHWTTFYKVAGFRFDLMGHHMKRDMLEVRAALDELTSAEDGVDGTRVYVYGEGWNFGEVANNARGTNATQNNMAGTGIGTFNDRLRDAVRGGSPFDSGNDLRAKQGFGNGLHVLPNAAASEASRLQALTNADIIRVGMTGNLRTYRLTDKTGNTVTGFLVSYNGANTGYTTDPQEVINYVSKHDNQTLWDIIAYKAPTATSSATRARMQALSIATVLYGQGVPFLHAGCDFLRSKSMERDSYDSGDWYNALDFTLATSRWNVGLPREDKDASNWALIGTLLADTTNRPQPVDMAWASGVVRDMLAVRSSSPLFRLRTEAEVKKRLYFHNTGPEQVPGLITLTVSDATCAGDDLDPNADGLFVVINARPEATTTGFGETSGWALHPRLLGGGDAVVRGASFDDGADTFTVPAWTAAVFVKGQGGAQGDGPACNPL